MQLNPGAAAGGAGRPQITVVIPTGAASQPLQQSLQALALQEGVEAGAMQVIVVADGYPREAQAAVQSVAGLLPVTVLSQPHSGPAAARNSGWRAASAQLILFLDAGHVAASDLVARHLAAHKKGEKVVAVGRIAGTPRPASPWLAYEAAVRDREYQRLRDGGDSLRGLPVGGNFSISVEDLVAAGGFDTLRLQGEHVELGLSLIDLGVQLRYLPEAVAVDIRTQPFEAWRQGYRMQGRFDAATYRDPAYGGLEVLVASIHDRHLLNRLSIRLALRWPRFQGFLERGYASVALAAHAAGARRAARGACGAHANLVYWSSIRDCLRSGPEMRRLVSRTRGLADRPYTLTGHRTR